MLFELTLGAVRYSELVVHGRVRMLIAVLDAAEFPRDSGDDCKALTLAARSACIGCVVARGDIGGTYWTSLAASAAGSSPALSFVLDFDFFSNFDFDFEGRSLKSLKSQNPLRCWSCDSGDAAPGLCKARSDLFCRQREEDFLRAMWTLDCECPEVELKADAESFSFFSRTRKLPCLLDCKVD